MLRFANLPFLGIRLVSFTTPLHRNAYNSFTEGEIMTCVPGGPSEMLLTDYCPGTSCRLGTQITWRHRTKKEEEWTSGDRASPQCCLTYNHYCARTHIYTSMVLQTPPTLSLLQARLYTFICWRNNG